MWQVIIPFKVVNPKIDKIRDRETRAIFIKHLLNDIKALEIMIEEGLIENDITRVGAEQEFCLVGDNWRPAKNSEQVLKVIGDGHFTTELARYNLEINLDPVELKSGCFTTIRAQLTELLGKATEAASQFDSRVLLTGILPTISKN